MMRFVGIALLSFICFVSMGIGQNAWSPEMQTKVKAVANVRVSPDASRVVYTVANEMMTAD